MKADGCHLTSSTRKTMKNRFHIARAGACLLLAASAASSVYAQTQTQPAADAQAAVPATRYQSTLGARPETAAPATPDQNWVAGNQLVAATNSMALTMKPMASHAGHGVAPAQAADPHAGHAGMQAMQGMNMGKQDSPDMCTPGAKDGAAAGGKMSCCQPACCCKDKMGKADQPKEAP
jgi:hypothetical protein